MDSEPQGFGADRRRKSPPRWTAYLLAMLAVGLGAGFRFFLDPFLKEAQPFTVFFTVAALISWRLGLGPGALALLLGAAFGDYLFVAPRGQLLLLSEPINGLVLWLNFCGLGLIVCWVCDYSRRARERAEAATHEIRVVQEELKKSEAQLRHISDTTPALIGFLDRDLVYRFANRQYETWFGLTRQEIIGHDISHVLGKGALAVLKPLMERALAGEEMRFEVEVAYRNGTRWIEGFYVPRREGEQVIGIYVLILDITSRKQAESASRKAQEALRLSEQRLRLALEAGSIGVWSADVATGIIESDERVLELFGLHGSPRLMPHATFFDRIHPEDREGARAIYQNAVENGHLFRLEYRVVLPDGKIRWVGGIGKKIVIESVPYVLGVNFDITDQKVKAVDLEAKVAERTASLETSLRSIEELLYTIAHDLRAPNRAMQGFAHLLLQDYWSQLDETGRSYLQRISESAIRSDQLIQDILQYGRLSHVPNMSQVVNVRQVLQKALVELEPAVVARNAQIRLKAEEPWPLWLGDEVLVKQIIVHLLANAIAYVAPGRQPEIQISAEPEGASAVLRVKDNGIGIPAEQQEQVFKPFVRLPTASAQPGTGMGLAIVRKAAERMNGQAGVESCPGEGSCFWVELPAVPPTRLQEGLYKARP